MEDAVQLIAVIRTLGTTWRALLLYPPESPMTADAAAQACAAIEEYLQAEPSLRLEVVRGGFVLRGVDGVLATPGVPELADALGSHGIGEIHFVAPPVPAELLALLAAAGRSPHELHEQGGVKQAMAAANAEAIRVVSVVLNKVEALPEVPEDEAEAFLARLAGDPDRLAQWLRSLLTADDEGLVEGLKLLADSAGDVRVFGRTLALAFVELDSDERDRLLESSITLEPLAPILGEMVANLSATELVAALRGGCYGANLLSLSFALDGLPLGDREPEILAETQAALLAADATMADVEFLRRMTELRRSGATEPSIADAQPYYRSAIAASQLTHEQVSAAQTESGQASQLTSQGAAVMLYLLDTADRFETFSALLAALSRAVPPLFEHGGSALALWIFKDVAQRSVATDRPWPTLDQQFNAALETMCGMRSMRALIAAYAADPAALETARELFALGGDAAGHALAAAAMESEAENAFELAQLVLGRRLAEQLAPLATTVDAKRAARLAELLARDSGPTCMQWLAQMVGRPEDQVRLETARGIAAAAGPALAAFMPRLLRDFSPNVASFAARVSGRHATPEVIAMLAARLDELEGDKDITLAREIISALGTSSSPIAEAALQRTAAKGGLLHKGRFAEIRQLAKSALDHRPNREVT